MTVHLARVHLPSTWPLACLGLLAIAATCQPTGVPIPDPASDRPPIITVSAVPSGGTGTVDIPAADPSACASPCKDAVAVSGPGEDDTADLVLTVQAKNPGGVKYLGVVVSQGGPIYSVSTSSTPDSQGRVPTTLQIWGTNGAGGIGSTPLLVHLSRFVHAKVSATVVVTAANFNGDQSIYTVTYYARGHVQSTLSVSKDHIHTDETTTFTWTVRSADQFAFTPPLPNVPQPLQPSDSKEIGNLPEGENVFTLTASDWLEAAPPLQKTITVEERSSVGGNISTHVTFTCPNTTIPAAAAFTVAGQCVGGSGDDQCTKPNPSSQPSYSSSDNEPVICSGGSGAKTVGSAPNLMSGNWTVTVTPNWPSMGLLPAEAFPCPQVKVKAGQSTTVNVRFTRKADLTWQKDCTISP